MVKLNFPSKSVVAPDSLSAIKILGNIGNGYLAEINNTVLENRQKVLQRQIKKFGWC